MGSEPELTPIRIGTFFRLATMPPALDRSELRRMSQRNRLTVGRVSLALQSESGASKETSTSRASSGTVARRKAYNVSSRRSSNPIAPRMAISALSEAVPPG